MCYSEYYAVNASGRLAHHFDRFCAPAEHCEQRGFDENCKDVTELDEAVRRTFYKKLNEELFDPKQLVYSLFCCCRGQRCNSLGGRLVARRFNVTATASGHLLQAPGQLAFYAASVVVVLVVSSIR